jgi:hypothetical protein
MKFYLNFYEDSGRLWKSTNVLDESTPYIEVDRDLVVEFNNGEKDLNDYVVVPSTKIGQTYELRFLYKEIDGYDVERSIHQISKEKELSVNSVIIKQNINKGTWSVQLTDQLHQTLNSTSYYKTRSHDLYVTYKDDPNILLDTLKIQFGKVLKTGSYVIENSNKTVAQNPNVSVYCAKIFDNYSHIVES